MGEDRRDSETAEVDQCWSVGWLAWVSGARRWALEGRVRPPMRPVRPYLTPTRPASFSGHYLGMGSSCISSISDGYLRRPCKICSVHEMGNWQSGRQAEMRLVGWCSAPGSVSDTILRYARSQAVRAPTTAQAGRCACSSNSRSDGSGEPLKVGRV